MADLVIRYVNGKRTVAIDHRRASRLECVLHEKSRERRFPLPTELEGLNLNQIIKAMEVFFHE